MAYRTILASLNEVAQVPCILNVAASVARSQEAHVIGLYVIPSFDVRVSSEINAMSAEDHSLRDYFKHHERSIRSAFEKAVSEPGMTGEFLVVDAPMPRIAPTVIEHSREVDFVIVGHSNSGSNRAVGPDFSERLIVSSGRPTLVVPPESFLFLPIERVMVGWNGSRESARAVFDSIPLLKGAGDVLIAFVGPESEQNSGKSDRLVRILSRHGIKARSVELDSLGEAGQVLLERAETREVGLLVMGAYGHARLREFILGGATRSVLKGMRIPVLFAH